MKVINLEEMILARKVVDDFPELIKDLDKCSEILYNNKTYLDIAKVLKQIEEAKIMLDLQLKVYTEVLKNAKEK